MQRTLTSTLTSLLAVTVIPASINQIDLDIAPVLGFSPGACFQVQVAEADFY